LGLSISAAILRAHGGRLRIEPREDAGTIATVTLPVREEAAHGE
jgi:signal transduction histidine kinase